MVCPPPNRNQSLGEGMRCRGSWQFKATV